MSTMFLRQCVKKAEKSTVFKRRYLNLEDKAIWLVAQGGNINVNGISTNDNPRKVITHFCEVKDYALKHHVVGKCKYGSMGIWILIKNE